MNDREKVLKGLEWVINDIEENGNINHAGQYLDAIKDALELLNEQEDRITELEHCLAVAEDDLRYYTNGNE